MQAVVLSAGKGTRLSDISKRMPKVMVSLNGKPLLQWHIERLKKQGITDIFINLHHLPEQITDYFGNGRKFGVVITYSHEKELLGTGGALVPFVQELVEDFVIIYGDVVTIVDFQKMSAFHRKHKALVTAFIHPSSHPEDSDLVELDTDNKIVRIIKKPHNGHALPKNPHSLAALYIFSPKVLSYLLTEKPFDIAQDFLPFILERKGRIYAYKSDETVMDIGTPERLEEAQKVLRESL